MAAAIGADLLSRSPPAPWSSISVAGTTEVAVIAMGGIVVSQSIRIAGDEFDQAILTHVRDAYNLAIGERTAEDIKIKVGSAVPLKDELDVEVNGRDVITRSKTVASRARRFVARSTSRSTRWPRPSRTPSTPRRPILPRILCTTASC